MKIVLLDFCSEKNRGDAAMQVGLIKLIHENFKDSDISIISVFGANQDSILAEEHDQTKNYNVSFFGGLKPTFFQLDKKSSKLSLSSEFLNALYFVPCLVLLIALHLKIRFKFINLFLPISFQKTMDQIITADFVIWNGRNFRSRKNRVLEIYRILFAVYHPLICGILQKPMACVGASVWNLKSQISKHILRWAFNNCAFISLREKSSFIETQYLLKLNKKCHLELLPDLSFAVLDDREDIIHGRPKLSSSLVPKIIGITLVDWKDEGKAAREAYKKCISSTIEYYHSKGSSVNVIPQVTKRWESNIDLFSDLISKFKNEKGITFLHGEPTVDELLLIYSKLDLLIATRMHSAIFAASVNTPFVAISYDKGVKWGILEELGYKEYILDYLKITPEILINKIDSCWRNRQQLIKNSEKIIDGYIKTVDQNVTGIINVLNLE